jgi:hypothetical protein
VVDEARRSPARNADPDFLAQVTLPVHYASARGRGKRPKARPKRAFARWLAGKESFRLTALPRGVQRRKSQLSPAFSGVDAPL